MRALIKAVLVFFLSIPAFASTQSYDCEWISEKDILTGQQVSLLALNRYELEVIDRTFRWTAESPNKQRKSIQECSNSTMENGTLKCLVESDYTTKESIFISLRTRSLYSFELRSMKLVKLSLVESQTRSDNQRSRIEREITYKCKRK
jgi:hypothetical protein